MKLLLSEVDFLRYKHFINLKNYIIYCPMLYSMGGGGGGGGGGNRHADIYSKQF